MKFSCWIIYNMSVQGPNGLFEPRPHKKIKCDGKHYVICQMLQMYDSNFPCHPAFEYNCLAGFRYVDETEYTGFYVKERIVLPVRDQRGRFHEVNGDGFFGCVNPCRRFPHSFLETITSRKHY